MSFSQDQRGAGAKLALPVHRVGSNQKGLFIHPTCNCLYNSTCYGNCTIIIGSLTTIKEDSLVKTVKQK